MRAARWVFGAVLLPLLGCASGTAVAVVADDPRLYTVAQDPAGAAAFARAQELVARGDAVAAIPEFRAAVTRCPDLVRAHLAYQDTARQLGGAAAAEMADYYRRLPDGESPVPAYVKARLADTSFARGNALQAIVARHPRFAWAQLSVARVQRSKGELLQAVDQFQLALALEASLADARLERAEVLVEIGRDEEAAVDFEAYLKLQPRDDAARHAYAQLLIYRLDRIERAMPLLDELERAGVAAAVRMDRAAAQWRSGDPRGAIATYLRVLASQPDSARALLNVGLLYYDVLPKTPEERAVFWPKARAAFELFLLATPPQDGFEQFERTLAVPFRLDVIERTVGAATQSVSLADLQLPNSG